MVTGRPLSRRPAAPRADLPREGGGEEKARAATASAEPTSPLRGEVDAMHRIAAGEGDAGGESHLQSRKQFVGGGKTLPRRIPGSVSGAKPHEPGKDALALARELRRSMTDAERMLWQALRGKRFENYKFRRQVPIGGYIADFVCLERRLVVEVDGGQHSESLKDDRRDAWFAGEGFRTLRFWNVDIFQALDGSLTKIHQALQEYPLPVARSARRPLPQGER